MIRRIVGATILALGTAISAYVAAGQGPASSIPVPKPGPMDLCPVCGMPVSKYPNWVATLVWKDVRIPRDADQRSELMSITIPK